MSAMRLALLLGIAAVLESPEREAVAQEPDKRPRSVCIRVQSTHEVSIPFAVISGRVKELTAEARADLTRSIVEGKAPEKEKSDPSDVSEKTVELVSIEEHEDGSAELRIRQRVGKNWLPLILDQTLEIDEKNSQVRIVAKVREGIKPIEAYSTSIDFAPSKTVESSMITVHREVTMAYTPGSVAAALAKSLFERQTQRLLQNAQEALTLLCHDRIERVAVGGK